MAINNSKLNFLSTWDIDQLVATGEVAVPGNLVSVVAIPAGLPALPVYEVYFKHGSGSKWYQVGQYSTANTTATAANSYSYIQNGQLFVATVTNGIVRYYFWQDRIDN